MRSIVEGEEEASLDHFSEYHKLNFSFRNRALGIERLTFYSIYAARMNTAFLIRHGFEIGFTASSTCNIGVQPRSYCSLPQCMLIIVPIMKRWDRWSWKAQRSDLSRKIFPQIGNHLESNEDQS